MRCRFASRPRGTDRPPPWRRGVHPAKPEEETTMAKKRTGVTRREFLQHAALASGAVALTGLVPTAALAAQAGEQKIGAQLIGKLEGPELDPGSRQVAQEVRRGPHAGRAGQGRQAPAGGEAHPRGADGREAAAQRRQVRRDVAARLHRARRRREREPHRLHGQDPLLGLHRHQDHAVRRQGLEGERRRPGRRHHRCARGTSGPTASPSPRTTSSSGTKTST